LTLGTKLKHNDFSGFEFQPSARAAWAISAAHMLWSAISRAVRVPTRLERDVAINASGPMRNPVVRLLGNKSFDSEELTAYELGYCWQPVLTLFLDLAAFHHRYEDLVSLEPGAPFIDPADGRTVISVTYRNFSDGHGQGIETLVTYAPLPRWRVSASYSYTELSLDPSGQDLNRGRFLEGSTPRHQFGLRSALDLPGGFQVDAHFRHHSSIRQIPELATGEGIGSYSEMDLRLAWLALKDLEVSIVGQNLLDSHHPEFGTPEGRGEIERSVYIKFAWGL
jgi:iron complex outermembrane receptor protein